MISIWVEVIRERSGAAKAMCSQAGEERLASAEPSMAWTATSVLRWLVFVSFYRFTTGLGASDEIFLVLLLG